MSLPKDSGAPISYVVLAPGTPVYSSNGARVGAVAHVLAAEAEDIFDGIVIGDLDHEVLGGHDRHRFIDAADVGQLYERAVLLTIDAAACRTLPAPSANQDQPADSAGSGVGGKLSRAWDLLSGNY